MKVLFATKNPAKAKRYSEPLDEYGIEVITIKDLDFDIEVDECGKDAIENASIKAKAYYDATKLVTIGVDDNLFIDGIPDEKQPRTYVRRINGKELNDDEMIEYYTGLAKEYGGKLTCRWVYGIAIYDGKEMKTFTWNKEDFYIVDSACETRNPGYPLNSISKTTNSDKYFAELTEEDKKGNLYTDNAAIEFAVNHIKSLGE